MAFVDVLGCVVGTGEVVVVEGAADDVVGLGVVVMAPLVDDGFSLVVVEEVMTGLGMKNPSAQTRPHPSKQHLPDRTPTQSASDLHNS